MVSINSTLVETVSINYEDFNESFLTCGTCLCVYNGSVNIPKLLPCSHTVCLNCLNKIISTQNREGNVFRCPICREMITIPVGGVAALPPSFLVNQLLDLMARQQRQIIPTCTTHHSQELYFCETCDVVFCISCQNGATHEPSSEENKNGDHTIVPLSVAIKRMSEILLYKANECLSKLSKARTNVFDELEKIDTVIHECTQDLDKTFYDIGQLLEARKLALFSQLDKLKYVKKQVLNEQLQLIEDEKQKVEAECHGHHYQTEVRAISQKISSLSQKLDSVSILGEPRENSYIRYNIENLQLKNIISHLGTISSTTTLPSLSVLSIKDTYIVNLLGVAIVNTVDYHGEPRESGGDPVSVVIQKADETNAPELPHRIEDKNDGTYLIKFRPRDSGRYRIKVMILSRIIKDGIGQFNVEKHNNPICIHGSRGSGTEHYIQPVDVAVDSRTSRVFVLDTGNSRIKVLTSELKFIKHIENPCLQGRSCTGMDIGTPEVKSISCWMAVVNWRTKTITRMDLDGNTMSSFTHELLQEPTDLAVDTRMDRIFVTDNYLSCIFVFKTDGELLFNFGKKGTESGMFNLISRVSAGINDEIVVADTRIQIFSSDGVFLKEIHTKERGRYGGLSVDQSGLIVATRTEKSRHFVQVIDPDRSCVVNILESNVNQLRRPAGIAVSTDNTAVVVDLGNNSVKKFAYW